MAAAPLAPLLQDPQVPRQGRHQVIAQHFCPQNGCVQLHGTCQTVSTGACTHNKMLDHPRGCGWVRTGERVAYIKGRRELWLTGVPMHTSRDKAARVQAGTFLCHHNTQVTRFGTEARWWRSRSRRLHSESGARAEKHKVHLEVSHSHPPTTRGHPDGSYIFGCQRSRGTSLKQAEESSWQMQPALLREQPCMCCRGMLVVQVD